MPAYRHTQFGTLMAFTFGPVIIGTAMIIVFAPETWPFALPLLAIMALVAALFYNLTVEVADDTILLTFGIGLIKRRIALSDVQDARAVQNRWWYGWGIRLTPYGWMWNVSGFDAVELEYTNGKHFRIGTDEPARLLAAIQETPGDTA